MYDSNKIFNNQVGNQSIHLSHQSKNNSGRVRNFAEFNKKYEKYFPETS